jgi:rod shape determining protein RodA
VLWRILIIARSTRDPFGQLLAVSTFLILLVSFVVSAGMNMGLLPVTGIPLPLVSYGGSNLVTTFVLLGIVESVRVYSKWVQAPPTELAHLT